MRPPLLRDLSTGALVLSRGAGIKVHALLLAAVAVCCSAVAGAELGCGPRAVEAANLGEGEVSVGSA